MSPAERTRQDWTYSGELGCFVIGSPNPSGYRLNDRQLNAVFGLDQLGILWVGDDLRYPSAPPINFGHDLDRALAWLREAAQ
jgi:hypothetical protein